MPLPLALVFHFNQHTSEYADIANRACYRGLLNVLRAHPRLKFNLHLSGTLLRALPWFDRETVDVVAAGVADGQFELLGSTYAQNVPFASDDWDNAQQIALHRTVLKEMFGVEPQAFWIAERSWRQSLLPVIADAGYTVTLIEDHILHNGGLVDPVPSSTEFEGRTLTAIYDDTILRARFNYAAWFGRHSQLFRYLAQIAAREGSDKFLLAYAEDAEAMGLWGWEQGYLPQAAWAHLDALLTEIEQSGAFTLHHLTEAEPQQHLPMLSSGAADWMNRALRNPAAPYHEDGYADWFDFYRRSPKLAYFGRLYAVLRARLQGLGSARDDPGFLRPALTPADRTYRAAIETFCHHQYEFGCIGIGGRGYWGWENARSAFMFARATEIIEDPRPNHWVEDVNGDGSDEQIISTGRELAVFTAHGGRLIYWLDLQSGAEWVGNHLAVPAARYVSGATKVPQGQTRPAAWLPETYTPDLEPFEAQRQTEPVPTALGNRLPAWIFEDEPNELTVYRLPEAPAEASRPAMSAQDGALAETLRVDDWPETSPDALLDYRFERDGLTYLLYSDSPVLVEKHVVAVDSRVSVRYGISNQDDIPHRLSLRTTHELCPDYAEALPHGRGGYTFLLHRERFPAVSNPHTGTVLVIEPSRQWQALDYVMNLLALEVALTFEFELAPRSQQVLEIRLNRSMREAAVV